MVVGEGVTDSDGTRYRAEFGFTGGTLARFPVPIAGTGHDVLYQRERYGVSEYTIPVGGPANYTVTLKAAELWFDGPGQRVFDVAAEGKIVAGNVDIFARAGGKNRAYKLTLKVPVTDGVLNLSFVNRINYAKIGSLVIQKGSALTSVTSSTQPAPPSSVTPAPTTTTVKPTTTTTVKPTTTAVPPSTGGVTFTPNGIPSKGALAGAAVGGNTDPSTLEKQIGGVLGLRRTFWGPTQIDSAVRTSKTDVASGRVPWISFKLPYSWPEMASGKGDAWAQELSSKLGQVNGPVWVAFHHEPEHEGSMADWTAMQRRLSPIMKQQKNIAFTTIVMGYHTFQANDPLYTLDKVYPGDGVIDIFGIDPYNHYGVKGNTNIANFKSIYFDKLGPWAKAHNVKFAIAETGYTPAAAAVDPGWLSRSYDQLVAAGGVGFSYFSSNLNSSGEWTLSGVRTEEFAKVVARSPKLP